MISYVILWYHMYYDIIEIIMISYHLLWYHMLQVISQYHIWYHTMMSACDIICDIICDTGTNLFILQKQLPLWLPPPGGVSLSPLPFFLPCWLDPAWQPPPPWWTSSWAVPVRSATARDSPRIVCCSSSDPAGRRLMLYQGFGCSCICRDLLDGCCSLWSRGWGGLAPAHLPLGRCIGRAIAGCWQCRTAWVHLPFAWCYLGSDWWARMCWNTPGTPPCGLLSILDPGSSEYKGCSWKRAVDVHTTPVHFQSNQSHVQHRIQLQDSDCWGKAPEWQQPPAQNKFYHIWYHIWHHINVIWYHIWYHISAQVTKHIYDITHDVP